MSRSPQQARAVATRERIARAALAAWCEQGFDPVSVEAVCRAAGVAKGSFYFHFTSKEDLLVGLVFGGLAVPADPSRVADAVLDQVGALPPDLVRLAARHALAGGSRPLRAALEAGLGPADDTADRAALIEATVLATLAAWGDDEVGDDPAPVLARRVALALPPPVR